jgi:AraC family transcriptional regulator
MVFHDFPDLQWLKQQAEDRFSNRQGWNGTKLDATGWPSVILNVSAKKTFRDNIMGPLSLFTNISGTSNVICENQEVTIRQGFFYLTNHDQRYSLAIDGQQETETFNIHFGDHWADQAYQTITKSADTLLEHRYFTAPFERIGFYNKLYYRDETVNHLIYSIKETGNEKLAEEEKLFALLIHLLKQDDQIRKAETRLPALKNSTRQEIIKRLLSTTDYIYAFYHKDLSLDELAGIACLSKFHFLRLFKIAFGQTPHQFVNEVRVSQAKTLLKNTNTEVVNIARQLGFTDASSFSRMFYNHSGVYPSRYR